MSNLTITSAPATVPVLTVSDCSSEAVTGNTTETGNAVSEEGNSIEMPQTSEHTKPTSATDGSDSAYVADSSSCSSKTDVDKSVTVVGATSENMLNESNQHGEIMSPESSDLTEAACELGSSVSEVKPAEEPVGGLVQSAEEQCRSDTVTFNLPLEVIGACWFMKRDTETCLQAATSNDGSFSCCSLLC